MVLTDITSTKDFLDASIANVVETLLIAIVLVVLVVYLFLHDLRATLIPSLAIVVADRDVRIPLRRRVQP